MNTQTAILLIVWLGPLLLAIGIGLVGLYFYGLGQLAAVLRSAPREAMWMLVAGLVIYFLTGVLMCITCYRVIPREAFANGNGNGENGEGEVPDPTLLADISAAEDAVCKLITRVNGFIQNDVGRAGQLDSSLVLEAQTKARDGVDMVDCSASDTVEIAHRLTRLEETLRSFTEPELQRTHDTTVRCEGFQDGAPTVRQRLTAIQASIHDQQTRLLAPIDAKTDDLRRGNASDCDKRRAAAATAAGQ